MIRCRLPLPLDPPPRWPSFVITYPPEPHWFSRRDPEAYVWLIRNGIATTPEPNLDEQYDATILWHYELRSV